MKSNIIFSLISISRSDKLVWGIIKVLLQIIIIMNNKLINSKAKNHFKIHSKLISDIRKFSHFFVIFILYALSIDLSFILGVLLL